MLQCPICESRTFMIDVTLAHLAVARPGWDAALSSLSQKMHGADLYQHFLTLAQEAQR